MRLAVGDDGGQRRLAAGAGGGGHGDHQRRLAQDVQQAAHLLHGLVRTGDARADDLGAVHRGAAAHGDDGLRVIFNVQRARLLDVVDGGVGRALLVDGAGDLRARQRVLQPGGQTEAAHTGVRDEQHGGNLPLLKQRRDFVQVVKEPRLAIGQHGQRGAEGELISAAIQALDGIHEETSSHGLGWYSICRAIRYHD